MNLEPIEEIKYVENVEVESVDGENHIHIDLADRDIEKDAIDISGERVIGEKGSDEHREMAEKRGNELANTTVQIVLQELDKKGLKGGVVKTNTSHEIDLFD